VARRGSVPSLVAGAATLLGSLLLQRVAVSFALRPDRRTGAAVVLLLLKLGGLLLLAYVGFETAWLAPMSFAVGATTLPVAIVLDACYGQWSSRRPDASAR
jgi:hypothetical protein